MDNRRTFLRQGALGTAALLSSQKGWSIPSEPLPDYRGPNVILIRFGGGVRRRETIDAQHTHSPFFLHELCPQGTLFPKMSIEQLEGIETSHGQGTLYILTGKYHKYEDIGNKFLGQRFEAPVPTLFEYLRGAYNVPEHQAIIINGEDRTDEEFYNFSNHHLFGAEYRSATLSLYHFKTYLLRRQIEEGKFSDKELEEKTKELNKLESLDYRIVKQKEPIPEIRAFWDHWRQYFGESGLVNARGDRLLTQIAIHAMKRLRPKLMMINYNDPDYVHWGNPAFYTRGISVIDRGIEQVYRAVQADEEYRDNTVFVIVPDCGRDSNRMMAVPYQHHFNSPSAHKVFALIAGPGIERGAVADTPVTQASITSTVGQIMGFSTEFTEAPVLEGAIA